MSERELIPLENSTLYKSNVLISAKYKSTLLENQVTALAFTRIQQKFSGESEKLIAEIYPSELKRILGSDNNVYRTLTNLQHTIKGKDIFIEDGKGNFMSSVIITDADYINGVFIITFNDRIKNFLFNLEKNYTTLRIGILSSFRTNSAFRLYELFIKEMYAGNPKYDKHMECVVVEYPITELKFIIGVCDINHPDISNIKSRMGKHIDYDVLYSKLPKEAQKYNNSADFMKRIIVPAQSELLEKSDIKFEYEGIKVKGNKVSKIRFYIYENKQNSNKIITRSEIIEETKNDFHNIVDVEYRQLELPMDINMELYEDYVGLHGITKEDIDVMLSKTNFDQARVREAINYVNTKDHIDTGFVNYVMSVLMHPEWDISEGQVVVHGKDINPELIKVAREYSNEVAINENKKKNPKEVWETVIKTRDDFNDFLKYMENKDRWDLASFEAVYDYNEMIEYWKNWKKNK